MFKKCLAASVAASLLAGSPLLAQEEESSQPGINEAILGGKAHLNLRYRFEHVGTDANDNDANASTLRFRMNYKTGIWRGWSGFGEFDYIFHLLANDFNSGQGTSPDKTDYPVVADPKGADLNQFYLDYVGIDDTLLRFGRQRINLDNQRFVGGVAWRQNEQTYDSASVNYDGFNNTKLFYSYVGQVNRIFGERSSAGTHNVNTHLLNAGIGLPENWKVTPYYYYIDNDDVAAFSTGTLGARLAGELKFASSSLKLVGEFATQGDVANNPVSYSANYIHFDAEWLINKSWSVGIGIESLGGDDVVEGRAFRTPLATLHKFQGWADQFLTTPNAGVDDLFVRAKYTHGKWNFQAVYHDFNAQAGSASWGSEIDLAAGMKITDRYSLLLKGGFFSADNPGFSDTNKFWLQLVANY